MPTTATQIPMIGSSKILRWQSFGSPEKMFDTLVTEAAKRFDVKKGSTEFAVACVAVDRPVSEVLLSRKSPRHGPGSSSLIKMYRDDMDAGRMAETADPMKMYHTGEFFDGVLRCEALLLCANRKAELRVPFTILSDPRAPYSTGIGRKRNVRFAHKMRTGEDLPALLITGCIFEEHDFKSRPKTVVARTIVLGNYPFLGAAKQILAANTSRTELNAGMWAGIMRCVRAKGNTAVKFFCDALDEKYFVSTAVTMPPAVKLLHDVWNAVRNTCPKKLSPFPKPLVEAYVTQCAFASYLKTPNNKAHIKIPGQGDVLVMPFQIPKPKK